MYVYLHTHTSYIIVCRNFVNMYVCIIDVPGLANKFLMNDAAQPNLNVFICTT